MPDSSTIAVFAAATLALLIVPGPSVIYVVTRSMDGGRTAGIVSVLGIHTGSLIHVGAAALGLSALLMTSALAFNTVKYAGAAYLIFLGIRRLASSRPSEGRVEMGSASLLKVFGQGVLVNALNPKTALFFFAFLPQFVDPSNGVVALQVLLLGCLFIGLGLLSDGAYAMMAATFGSLLRASTIYRRAERFVTGGVLVGLGLTAALSHSGGSRK
jgi:threonine/homoserine/homoserine lactone efflux protein